VTTLTGILNDFLSLARLEEGGVEVHPEVFEFNSFCSEVTDEMQSILKTGQVIIANHFEEKVMVNLDKKLLKLILINLISNATKYSDEKTEIVCNTELIKNKFRISIKDHGIGIPEEDIPHMFDRFFRASNAINIKGTGLGLNIVKRYVELMDGFISFETELGKGSIFTVVFNLKGT
jgi:signal transduction histidine kinase